jgi:adenylate cyclase
VTSGSRRLAAIMFTDLVGFTRLGQRDEDAALRLRREHQEIARPIFRAHGGREVKTTGDGFLVEFPSAIESVRCAVELQSAIARRNALPDAHEPIVMRVGIHVGDVVDDQGDIVGDAVNVASRIEPLADPGGVCVSGSVYDQVRNKLTVPLEPLGARSLKHVDFPVEVYRVLLGRTVVRATAATTPPEHHFRLAVLPLANLSPSAEDDFFADGLTDELITQTAKIPSLRVIARTSVLQYKGSPKPVREVARELGVGLALEGSVRKAGNRLRVTVQLVDATTEVHLWGSKYDRPLGDIFQIQDDIAGQIATAMAAHFSAGGKGPPETFVPAGAGTQNLDAYTRFLHARKLFLEKGSEDTIRESVRLFEEALRLDPSFARARVGLADTLQWLASEGAIEYLPALHRAREELTRAIAENDALAEAHSSLGGLLLTDDDYVGTERESRRAIELNPSLSDPYRWLAQLEAGAGRMDEAIRMLETAQQIDPADVNVVSFLGHAYLYAGREREALAHWERTQATAPYRTNAHLTEYFLGKGDLDRASETVRELVRLRPDNGWTEMYSAILAARRGDTALARQITERLERRSRAGELTGFFAGFARYALGDQDEFVASMQQALELRALPLLELLYSPLLTAARDDPRIQEILRRQLGARSNGSASASPGRTP